MPLTPRLPLFAATLTLLALMLAAVALNAALPPAAQAQTTTTTVDYDSNDDGLIEIANLAQLNAIRWDLNGDGAVAAADQANYAAAFPNAAAGMGCPDGSDADTNPDPCKGYELKADLTFDSNGDGIVTAADSGGLYWNGGAGWTPLGDPRHDSYTGEFQGRGKVISHLFINNASPSYLGLFGAIGHRGRVNGLGLEQVSISSRAAPIAGSLVGSNVGVVTASYATGTLSSNASSGGNATTGGLVGYNGLAGTVQASFADVAVSNRHSRAAAIAGGLVGQNSGSVQASYATGAVSVHGTTRRTRAGGLVGSQLRNGRVTNSYWDTATSGLTSSAGGTGQTSSALKTPTGYTGIYASWNLNLDGVAGGDTPWYFGRVNQYPVPVYGAARDYDADNDRLIEVDNLTQLNAIRWDLNGDGVVAAADQANYAAAYPWPATGMGCADGAAAAACIGYELQTDLNFDTNGNGSIDANDQFWNNGAGWLYMGGNSAEGLYLGSPPHTGPFQGTFQGNGKTIANLYMSSPSRGQTVAYLGLFGVVGLTGIIDSVELRNVNIRDQSSNGTIGPLAAINYGSIQDSWVTGRIDVNSKYGGMVGGLVSWNFGSITSSYANTEISGDAVYVGGLAASNQCHSGGGCGEIVASYSSGAVSTTSNNYAYVGGLVGANTGPITASYSLSPVKATGNWASVGGLVGFNYRDTPNSGANAGSGTITASYAVGPVVATGTNSSVGGLVGVVGWTDGGTAVNSYWDTEVSGQSSSALGTGKTTAELTAPTGYSGIYSNWNLNLDGKTGNDDPWDFTRHYPKLKYGSIDRLDQLYIRIYFEDLVLYPLVGERMKTSLNAGPGLTRANSTNTPGLTSSAFVWERSDDGVTGWTVVLGPGVGSDRQGYKSFLFVPEPSEANKRFRVRVLSVERGWIYSYPTPPVKASWTGATAAASFASGHNPPRVGQPITVDGGFAVWIRCNDTAGNSCAVIGDAPGITPNASEQGKYLYAYRYYTDSNGVLTKASTGFIGPVQAAASPSP